jgi:hypothetical protein
MRWTGRIERAGNINEYILFRKTESKISPGGGHTWDNNIKERGFVELDCIVVQRDMVQWWVLVNFEMNPWGSRKSGELHERLFFDKVSVIIGSRTRELLGL